MQASEVGNASSIKFQPSPNFKYMRKYFKAQFSRYQCTDELTLSLNKEKEQQSEPMHASTSGIEQPDQHPLPVNSRSLQPPPLHNSLPNCLSLSPSPPLWPPLPPNNSLSWPPLPPNPLPPLSPPAPYLSYCQEMEGEKYYNRSFKVHPQPEEREMCKEFIRGVCTRGPSCIFAHKLIISQLHDVYTFCHDFQNSACKLQKCKFVHATVFEKEHFYRTGYLPMRALAHLKKGFKPFSPSLASAKATAKSTYIMSPSPKGLPGLSSQQMSGACQPYVLPVSGMYGPTPRTYPAQIPPPVQPTDFLKHRSPNMLPGVSTLDIRGNYPPDVEMTHQPLSESLGLTRGTVIRLKYPPVQPTDFLLQPSPSMLPGMSTQGISGNYPPDVEMAHQPLPKSRGPRRRTGHRPKRSKCSNCEIAQCRLLKANRSLRKHWNTNNLLREQKARDDATEAKLNKLIAVLTQNDLSSRGMSNAEQKSVADLMACGFLLSELKNKPI